jgi:hypothetical protein
MVKVGTVTQLFLNVSGKFCNFFYHILSNVIYRGPLRLVGTTEELFERKRSGSGIENREYGRRDPSC